MYSDYRAKFEYPVHYQPDQENPELWEAHIPGLDGTLEGPGTCGDNLEDARRMASGLLDAWIVTHLKQGKLPPPPGQLPDGLGWEVTRPSLKVAWVLLLRILRHQQKLTQAEAAQRLKVSQPVYARLEDPRTANPTLRTVQRLGEAFALDLALVASGSQ